MCYTYEFITCIMYCTLGLARKAQAAFLDKIEIYSHFFFLTFVNFQKTLPYRYYLFFQFKY